MDPGLRREDNGNWRLLTTWPQFTAVFSDWDFAPRIDQAVFTPELPPGTEKIPFATVAAK